jgi:hypothetical protein
MSLEFRPGHFGDSRAIIFKVEGDQKDRTPTWPWVTDNAAIPFFLPTFGAESIPANKCIREPGTSDSSW